MARSISKVCHRVRTDDGYVLALYHYLRLDGSRPSRPPVLLCHGLSANHQTFDLEPDASLASVLTTAGYDVFAIDLRGRGQSRHEGGHQPYAWTFDDYLHLDVPSVLARIADETSAPGIHWIGHSMGGILGLTALTTESQGALLSVTAVGSSLDYTGGTGFSRLMPLRPLLERLPRVPVRMIARASALRPGGASRFERFNVNRDNVRPDRFRKLCRTVFHDVSPRVMLQLGTALTEGGLRSWDGDVRYVEALSRIERPVFLAVGEADPQCPPHAAQATFDALPKHLARMRLYGPSGGHRAGYNHFDLLIGDRADREVFPDLLGFLAEHDVGAGDTPRPHVRDADA